MTVRHRHRLPFGAEPVSNDLARFRLWAPSCDAVDLVVEGGPALPMLAIGEGWYELDAPFGAGSRYRYRVHPREGDALLVPDPASRAQSTDVHDPSVVVDPEAFRWTHDAWVGRPWCETVIYELHVGLCGGFAGVKRLLPALAALGVTAIELMPVNDFAGPRNWGYDGVLPFAPDAAYGTPDELKDLVDTAHGYGLMVFLDVVYNHFGPDGNYLGAYADAFFRDDVKTPWGRAIDFRRREVRDFFAENAVYWLQEYRFDGLRLDATHAIVPQDWLRELHDVVTAAIDPARHVHLVLEHEGNAAHLLGPHKGYDAQWNDDGHHVLHVLLTGESDGYYVDFAGDAAEKLARCLSEGFVYQGEPSPFRNGETRGEPSAGLPPSAFVLALQNHDQIGNRAFGERLTTLADPAALLAARAMQLLCPQIPLLYMGEEFGERRPYLFFTSFPDEALAAAVCEGRRGEFAGSKAFSDPASRERIPDPNAQATFDDSRPDFAALTDDTGDAHAAGWLSHTRTLLAVRRALIVPRLAGARSLGAQAVGPAAVVARWALADGAVFTLAVNLHAEAIDMPADRFHAQPEQLVYATPDLGEPVREGRLPGRTTWAFFAPRGAA